MPAARPCDPWRNAAFRRPEIARFEKATRNRPPVLGAGVEVRVLSGPLVGEQGVILDADYIESRVQLQLPDRPTPVWVAFSQIGPPRHAE